jgi:hemin uptake protein HemP
MDDAKLRQSCRHATTPDKQDLPAPHFCSAVLFAGRKMIVIEHAGREYQLRLTSANKLILTA